MNKYFLKYKFAYLLAALFITSTPQNTATNAHIILTQFARFVQEEIHILDAFLSKDNKKTYPYYVEIMGKANSKYPLTVRSAFQSELEKETTKIAEEFRIPFIQTQNVLQKYRGKNKGFAGNLVKELRGALSLDQLLLKLKTRLICLKEKALRQNDIELEKTIKRFIAYIDQKIIIWNKKSSLELFSALCRRMELR